MILAQAKACDYTRMRCKEHKEYAWRRASLTYINGLQYLAVENGLGRDERASECLEMKYSIE
jgi:hypothetical protein